MSDHVAPERATARPNRRINVVRPRLEMSILASPTIDDAIVAAMARMLAKNAVENWKRRKAVGQ